MRKVPFAPGEYYHIYNRTILSAPEFKNGRNAARLAQAFLLANSTNSTKAFEFLRNNENASVDDALKISREGEKLVDILCYSVMPDHYHLLVKELRENGISNFIRKCNISVAKYINTKNDRRGTLFESRFNAKHINTNDYLLHLSLYIHLNPLDIVSGREWRMNNLQDWEKVREKLLRYPWSSLGAYLEDKEDQIISGTEIVLDQFNDEKDYESFLQDWSENSLEKIKDLIIEPKS